MSRYPDCPFVTDCEGSITPWTADNYMDYIPDFCMTDFTPMQMQHMRTTWKELREGVEGW